MKPPLIIIAGATATGKTDLAIGLAEQINGEIISADSMQIYKYMDIGTAKPTKEEMRGIPHHLIDELYPDEEYSVAVFQKMAHVRTEEIYAKGKVPILTGGTGFYINALVRGTNFEETETDSTFRESLLEVANSEGARFLHERLRRADPEAAEQIHQNNVKRVVRALEYFEQTGQKISAHNERERKRESVYDTLFLILNRERALLYERINKRVDVMMRMGLVDEVAGLLKMGYDKNSVSMQGLGYKEIVGYLENRVSLEQAVETLKTNTRHFAKKQLTWFKHQVENAISEPGEWINVDENAPNSVLLEAAMERYKKFQGKESVQHE